MGANRFSSWVRGRWNVVGWLVTVCRDFGGDRAILAGKDTEPCAKIISACVDRGSGEVNCQRQAQCLCNLKIGKDLDGEGSRSLVLHVTKGQDKLGARWCSIILVAFIC